MSATGSIELPFGLPGRIYRSPMPFGSTDPEGLLFTEDKDHQVELVVLLASDSECLSNAGRDLKVFYILQGMKVTHFPIEDFSIPDSQSLDSVLDQALNAVRQGQNIAVHCWGGNGRTGLFLAVLAKRVLGFDGEQALAWVRQYVPRAVENGRQEGFVREAYHGKDRAR